MRQYDSRDDWRDFDRESRRGGVRAIIWIVAVMLVVALISIATWWFRVATSDVKGRGDATVAKNSAANRIKAQEAYVSAMNEVKRADRNLDTLAAAAKDSAAAKTRYVGAISYCQSAVADYDKLYDSYRSADFLPAGYPVKVDSLDPATDCKETAP